MAINTENCEAYFRGEVRPLIFEVYTDSGIPFSLIPDFPNLDMTYAYCEVKDDEGEHITRLPAKWISDQPAKKQLLVSWDTENFAVGYYRLQIWVLINVTGSVDKEGRRIVEAKLASEDILRYIKEH